MFYNIFINDLFQHVKYAKLNAYADYHQIYPPSLDPLALEECICQEVNVANQWYKNNGIIVNKKKHQALIRGKTEPNFSFPVNNSTDILVKVKNSSPPPTVGQLSANCRPTDGQLLADSWPTVGRQTADRRPTDGQLSAVCRPTSFSTVVTICWPTVGRLLVICR